MVDYSKSEKFHIEDVDHKIHILGVTVEYWPAIGISFLIFMPFNPLFGPILAFFLCALSRRSYLNEQKGEYFIYSKLIRNVAAKCSYFSYFFPSLSFLGDIQDEYR